MFAGMIPMVISILDRERPLQAPTQISSLECTHNNNRSVIHLHYANSHYAQYTVLVPYIFFSLTEVLSFIRFCFRRKLL